MKIVIFLFRLIWILYDRDRVLILAYYFLLRERDLDWFLEIGKRNPGLELLSISNTGSDWVWCY